MTTENIINSKMIVVKQLKKQHDTFVRKSDKVFWYNASGISAQYDHK